MVAGGEQFAGTLGVKQTRSGGPIGVPVSPTVVMGLLGGFASEKNPTLCASARPPQAPTPSPTIAAAPIRDVARRILLFASMARSPLARPSGEHHRKAAPRAERHPGAGAALFSRSVYARNHSGRSDLALDDHRRARLGV